jgi:MOSC domain-containing protein YiiM
MTFVAYADLAAGLGPVLASPTTEGRVELVVARPAVDEREIVATAILDTEEGLVGDGWRARGSTRTPDGAPVPGRQLTLMNARVAALLAGDPHRWALAGDQLYVDLDLSVANLPPGTQLEVGSAVIEASDEPHRGCAKFAARYGRDAVVFVNSPVGRELNLRGINAHVIANGVVHVGDVIRKR